MYVFRATHLTLQTKTSVNCKKATKLVIIDNQIIYIKIMLSSDPAIQYFKAASWNAMLSTYPSDNSRAT